MGVTSFPGQSILLSLLWHWIILPQSIIWELLSATCETLVFETTTISATAKMSVDAVPQEETIAGTARGEYRYLNLPEP